MNSELVDAFFDTLFEPTDQICFSETPYGTALTDSATYPSVQFFSINALSGPRKDDNVNCYRNILIEMDEGTLEQQMAALSSVPTTSIVYSGGKSLHAIISLHIPCKTREEYDSLVRRIYDRIPGVDRSCKNPSRFSRVPEAMRNNGKKQTLSHLGFRIHRDRLEAWLGPDVAEEAGVETVTYTAKPLHRILRADTWYFLSEGAPRGEWNRQLFLACIDMCRAGFPNEEIMQRCLDVTGKLTASDKRTIASAIKIVKAEK